MNIVIDTSAILAVILDEPERNKIIGLTAGHSLICPGSISWEIGNAFSSMLRKKRIDLDGAKQGINIFYSIPLRFVKIDIINSLSIAARVNIFAYDAYMLDCSIRYTSPLLTLDKYLIRTAKELGINILEV